MKPWLRGSVQRKLTTLTMTTCVAALLLAGVGIIASQLLNARQTLEAQLASRADLMGTTTAAAVQFLDGVAGQESLSAFRSDPDVEAARIDLVDGTAFATYTKNRSRIADGLPPVGVEHFGETMVVSRAITLDGRSIGSIRVQGSLSGARAQVWRFVWILGSVLVASCVVAYLLSRRLQRVISGPIVRLAAVTRRVSVDRDYRVRAVKESDDELGELVEQFNDMLIQIEQRDEALRDGQAQLEARVRERTENLELEIIGHRRTENALLLAKASAEEASVAKSAFLANMSHELRTPLNAIIGYSEMLMEEAEDRGALESQQDLTKIITAGRHLLALITDVLDLSKIEAGRMETDIEVFDAAALVQGVVSTSQTLASTRGNRLTVTGCEGLGDVQTDPTKLRQILLNLVGNACKFTSGGEVRVQVRRERLAESEWLVVDIVDSGIGMTPDQVHRLFNEFMQADASTTRRFGGTGLGLAISQRLCRLLGGEISVQSVAGQGSTFTVRVLATLAVLTGAAAPSVEFARSPAAGRPVAAVGAPAAPAVWSVVVVDDDATSRDLMARALERAGCHVRLTASAEEGLTVLRESQPDAVVLDLMLPGMSGWELLEAIKSDEGLSGTPVVIASILDDRRRSQRLGAAAHLVKPVAADRLVEAVHAAFEIQKVS